MKVGRKAQGFKGDSKAWVVRHGHAPRRSPRAQEKAIETRCRRAGKRECREARQAHNG